MGQRPLHRPPVVRHRRPSQDLVHDLDDPRDPVGDLPRQARPQPGHRVPGRLGVRRRRAWPTRTSSSRSTPCWPIAPDEEPKVTTVGSDSLRIQTVDPDQRPGRGGQGRARRRLRRARRRTSRARSSGRRGARTSRKKAIIGILVFLLFVDDRDDDLLPQLADGRRGAHRAVPRPDHHGRRVRGGRLGGHAGDGDRLPDDPRVLDLRHGRRVRQGAREHRGHARAVALHVRREGQPRGQPDARAVDQHLRRRPAARRRDPVRRRVRPRRRARCATSRSRCSSAC